MRRPQGIPKWPYLFFKFYCKKERFEEMHGDLEEYFYERVESMGKVKARWYYLRDVLRCCQPYAWKTPHLFKNSNFIMFKNYFKTARRSALRNPLSSFINVFGLSMAIGVCVMTYSFMNQSLNTDKFHENKDSVFLTTIFADRDGKTTQYGVSPLPLAEHLKEDFANIEKVCRIDDQNAVIRLNDQVFYEDIRMVDGEFLEMFTFPLKWGNASSLYDPNSIILSEELSDKYFKTENPLGKEVLVIFKTGEKKYFEIAGVAEDFPNEAEIQFDFLINYANIELAVKDFNPNDWSKFLNATLIQVNDPSAIGSVASGMKPYIDLQNEVNEDWAIQDFQLISINDLYLSSADIQQSISHDDRKPGRLTLPFISAFMLILACLNYINMAINSIAKRLKEIGVRKVMGADKRRVMVQFLAENVLITSCAMIFGLFLGIGAFMPWFEGISGSEYSIQLSDQIFYLFLLGLLLLTGIASGIYPAFYISRFQAVNIFKGKVKLGRKGWLTKSFLGFQLVLAVMTITSAVVFVQNTNFQMSRSWGYDQSHVLYIHAPSKAMYDNLYAALERNPYMESISGSVHHIGRNRGSSVAETLDRKYEVNEFNVESGYFKTMGIELMAGRFFSDNVSASNKEMVVNQTLINQLELQDPLGQEIKINEKTYMIVGVMKDFHNLPFGTEIEPMVFTQSNSDDLGFITASISPGHEIEVYNQMESTWDELYPEIPFDGGLQADIWNGYFNLIGNFARFNKSVAGIAVALALLGLYGLMTLNISGRMKELSIRKALGAEFRHLSKIMSKQYVMITFFSIAIGAPMGFYFTKFQLDMVFAYPLDMGAYRLVIPVLILVVSMSLVVITQIFRVNRFNPVKGLRTE